jgi:lipopolysaccharide export system protein LptC
MRIISIILSVIALIGSAYSYVRTSKAIKKIEDLDNAIFHWMKEDFNSKVDRENRE